MPGRSSLPSRVRRRLARSAASRRRRTARRLRVLIGRGTPAAIEPLRPTRIGPAMDAVVDRARGLQEPVGLDPDYDLVRAAFDHTTYELQTLERQGLAATEPVADPIREFLDAGAGALSSPDPSFAMGPYLDRNPHRRTGPEQSPYVAWLREGRRAGEIADPAVGLERMAPVLGMTPQELVGHLAGTREDLTERLRYGVLGDQLARAAEIEPLIGAVWGATTRPRIRPVEDPEIARQTAAMHALQAEAGHRRARLVLVINRPRWGGGRRIEGHVTHALCARVAPEEIVVVHTDEGGLSPEGRYPAGVREIDFAAATAGLSPAAVSRVLVELLRSLRAEAILGINSRVLYEALIPYGDTLAATERIFPVMFCNEQLPQGHWAGWSLKHFYRVADQVAGIITDSRFLQEELTERNLLDDGYRDRIHVFRAPVQPEIPLAPVPPVRPDRRPRVYWAGRWDRQKRIDLVLRIARALPEVDFHLWGEPVLHGAAVTDVPANVTLEGRYARFADLDLGAADAWLYTSAWDGVPQLLLEVAMTGVPIVASLVGGVGELVDDAGAWPVRDVDDPAAYADAIRAVLADPAAARARSRALRERLLVERSEQAYAEAAATLLLEGES